MKPETKQYLVDLSRGLAVLAVIHGTIIGVGSPLPAARLLGFLTSISGAAYLVFHACWRIGHHN